MSAKQTTIYDRIEIVVGYEERDKGYNDNDDDERGEREREKERAEGRERFPCVNH